MKPNLQLTTPKHNHLVFFFNQKPINHFNSIQFNSIQFNSIQFNSIQFNSIQFNSSSVRAIKIQRQFSLKQGLLEYREK
ncbi:hypothetical protein CY658_01085 [Variovorax sp. RO1]|nr:hypothetical protein CY658_01085 [Variovorax sp. RO1]